MGNLSAPFPYFGGKSKIVSEVWRRMGNTPNYVEPFFGSGAMLLARPNWSPKIRWIETVNDKDGLIANFWRALQAEPDAVAGWADWPVNENDLHARHLWLVARKDELQARLEGDPDYCDAKIAGWWVWGMACWIGSGFCSGRGPWQSVDGLMVKTANGDAGHGVNRKLVHLGDAGRGVNNGAGRAGLYEWFNALSERLRRVRVCSGDWSRVCGPTPTFSNGLTAVFLDPPYSAEAMRDNNLYRIEDDSVAHDVREWAIANGDNPLMRIALCGYEGEHDLPDSWEVVEWKAHGGYSVQGNGDNLNAHRERIWFSPHCLNLDAQRAYVQPILDGFHDE